MLSRVALAIAVSSLFPHSPARADAPARHRHPAGLPVAAMSASANPRDQLRIAAAAVRLNWTGAAQEALERAETRLIQIAVESGETASVLQAVQDITTARLSLQRHDRSGAVSAIEDALLALAPQTATAAPSSVPANLLTPPVSTVALVVPTPPPPPSARLYRQRPGHWELSGTRYVWVEPERTPRSAGARPIADGIRFWNGDRWQFEPPHLLPVIGK